jgi:tryptophan synthase alpha subunit
MGRLAETFARIRKAGEPGLVTYVTAGDPDIPRSEGILRALDRAGADVLEVGVPFSDPLADGPVIQRATERALASGTTLVVGPRDAFEAMNRALTDHRLRPVVDRVFGFDEVPEAFEHLASGRHFGKVAVRIAE